MPALGPFKLPYPDGLPGLKTFKRAMRQSSKQPPIGITQGGSSRRKDGGARVAATSGQLRQTQTGEPTQ